MKGMQTKEDCPYKWITIISYVMAIVQLYYSLIEYGTLYGVYKQYFDIPNFEFHFNFIISIQFLSLFLVVLFIGVITDKYGPGLCFLLQSHIIVLGQLLICISVYTKYFYIMYPARIMICVGCSSIAISKGVYCRDYFLSTHLALTNSMTSMSFTVAQIVNLYFVWLIYNSYGLLVAELFALFLNLLGFILVYFIYSIDNQNNKYLSLYSYKSEYHNINQIQVQLQDEPSNYQPSPKEVEIEKNNKQQQINSTTTTLNQNQYISKLQNVELEQKEEKLSVIDQYIQDMSSLSNSYWVGSLTIAVTYISLMTYIMLGPAICQQYMGLTPQEASYYVAFLPNITLIMPLVGKAIDHYKNWFDIYFFISFFAVVGTLCLLFKVPIIAFLTIGLGYGTRTSAEFPLICFLVEKKIAGRAYSITRAGSNIFLSAMMFLNSIIVQYTGTYFYTLVILLSSGILISVLITIAKYLHYKEVKSNSAIQSQEIKSIQSTNHS